MDNYKIDLTKSTSTWPLSVKIKRGIWQVFIRPLFMLLPNQASQTRIWFLRFMGAKIGKRCLIEPRVKILMPWNLDLGDFVVIGHDAEIYNYALVKIDSMTVYHNIPIFAQVRTTTLIRICR